MLHDLLKMDREQKSNWPLHLSSLVFAYNATLHSVTVYQLYEVLFGHKAPTVCNGWLGLEKYNDQYLQSKSTWVNEQHEQTLCVGGSPLNIPKDNLVLLRDHPEGRHKIQDNYKSELFVVVSKHKDPNVYTMHPLCGGLVYMVNQ